MPSRALCAYMGCTNSKKKRPDLSFHRFSTDLCEDWVIRCGNLALLELNPTQLANKRICSEHFENSDFFEAVHGNKRLRVLKRSALPINKSILTEPGKKVFTCHILKANESSIGNIGLNESGSNVAQNMGDVMEVEPISIENGSIDAHNICDNNIETVTVDVIQTEYICVENSSIDTLNLYDNNSKAGADDEMQTDSVIIKNEKLATIRNKAKLSGSKNESTNITTVIGKCRRGSIPLTRQESKMKARIIELEKKVKNQKRVIQRLKTKLEHVDTSLLNKLDSLNEEQTMFFKMQINHIKRIPWKHEEKQFALDLFFKSPRAYTFLRDEKHFHLPSVSAVQDWVNDVNLCSEIS